MGIKVQGRRGSQTFPVASYGISLSSTFPESFRVYGTICRETLAPGSRDFPGYFTLYFRALFTGFPPS